ncbi:ribonucleolar protein, putative [Theileria annulata]|uniref:Nucleolar protein 56 n=1 Tax=Theileria annulata TaxID=5874 RepID=Q4UHT6_THEAN|nr:ribonucleolar protein, putative [Theileria annulata]CAI73353.1 ribonucleolar protein, putative [Theileria annulata]|eukprot:XP_954030.1 ribonucleolar protein, putative [Theileria annulata]
MTKTYLLFETAAGYGLYQIDQWDQIGSDLSLDELVSNSERFSGTVKFKAFQPFRTAKEALENMRSITEGEATLLLTNFLSQNLPSSDHVLAIVDVSLAKSLSQKGFKVIYDSNVLELVRGCRLYETKRLTKLASGGTSFDMNNFQVGLGHSYSRSKLKFDPSKQDKPIINSVSLLDTLTKNLNSFAMRVREWYGWHFPELCKLVPDNKTFCEAVKLLKKKEEYDFENLEPLSELLGEELALTVKKASRHSIGHELADLDLENILNFADNVIKLDEMRNKLNGYLNDKVSMVAPNLNCVVGTLLSGRLISHAGSLVNLAKSPASTIQILGAEKALFRALKSRTNTPKYGLLFQSTFIGKASNKHKGKAARYLANKCALAARLDYFCDVNTDIYGKKMSEQLTKRMNYLLGGPQHDRNINVMKQAHEEYKQLSNLAKLNEKAKTVPDDQADEKPKKKRKTSSKKNKEQNEAESMNNVENEQQTSDKVSDSEQKLNHVAQSENLPAVDREPTKKPKKSSKKKKEQTENSEKSTEIADAVPSPESNAAKSSKKQKEQKES